MSSFIDNFKMAESQVPQQHESVPNLDPDNETNDVSKKMGKFTNTKRFISDKDANTIRDRVIRGNFYPSQSIICLKKRFVMH